MKIDTPRVLLIVIIGILSAAVIARPEWLSDGNSFLRDFVNHEYLNVLSLNRIEEQRRKEAFRETRGEIKEAAYWLIFLFFLGFLVVVAKPLICVSETSAAVANAIAILILAMYVLILVDITMAVFDIKAEIKDDDAS